MKKLLLIAAIGMGFTTATHAQVIKNNTQCYITVTAYCYDPTLGCPPVLTAAGSVTVSPGQTPPPSVPGGCLPPDVTMYEVCWDQTQCPTVPCVDVEDPHNHGCFPSSDQLQQCVDCNPGGPILTSVSYDPVTGNIIIN